MGSDEKREVWERQPDESARDYARFEIYRELGPNRTVERAYHQITANIKSPKLGLATLRVLASRKKWVSRADQWDAFAQRAAGKSVKERVKREALLESKIVRVQMRVAAILARRLFRYVTEHPDYKLSPGKLTYVTESLTKLSRLMRGDSTDRTEVITREEQEDLGRRLERLAQDPSLGAEPRDEARPVAAGPKRRLAREAKP